MVVYFEFGRVDREALVQPDGEIVVGRRFEVEGGQFFESRLRDEGYQIDAPVGMYPAALVSGVEHARKGNGTLKPIR